MKNDADRSQNESIRDTLADMLNAEITEFQRPDAEELTNEVIPGTGDINPNDTRDSEKRTHSNLKTIQETNYCPRIAENSSLSDHKTIDVTTKNTDKVDRQEKSSLGAFEIEIEIMTKAKILSSSQGKEIYVSYWDLGGDEIYHATHHAHLSSDAVYLLVFDVSGMEEIEERKQNLGE